MKMSLIGINTNKLGTNLNDGISDNWTDSLLSVPINRVLATDTTQKVVGLVKAISSIPDSIVVRDSFGDVTLTVSTPVADGDVVNKLYVDTTASAIQAIAENAQADADNAQGIVTTALAIATTAQSIGEAAQVDADSAQVTADNALSDATNALADAATARAIGEAAHVTANEALLLARRVSNRNVILNGSMNVAHRGTSFPLTPVSSGSEFQYTINNYIVSTTNAGPCTYMIDQASTTDLDVLSLYKTLKLTRTSVSDSSASHVLEIEQCVDGLDFQRFNFGTANALAATLSVVLKSSVAGNVSVCLQNSARDRSYKTQIAVTTGWNQYNFTVPGDTTGTWLTDKNTIGLRVLFVLGNTQADNVGTMVDSWLGNSEKFVIGSLSFCNTDTTLNDFIEITGLQFEVGIVATAFEYRVPPEIRPFNAFDETVDSTLYEEPGVFSILWKTASKSVGISFVNSTYYGSTIVNVTTNLTRRDVSLTSSGIVSLGYFWGIVPGSIMYLASSSTTAPSGTNQMTASGMHMWSELYPNYAASASGPYPVFRIEIRIGTVGSTYNIKWLY